MVQVALGPESAGEKVRLTRRLLFLKQKELCCKRVSIAGKRFINIAYLIFVAAPLWLFVRDRLLTVHLGLALVLE